MSAGILQFSLPIYRITESGEWLTERVQVIRTGGSTGAISVKVTGKSETATIGKDIEKISQTLTWADGDTIPKFVDIKPIQDMYTEGDEFITLSLSGIKTAKYTSVKTAQLVISEKVNLVLATPSDSLMILVHNVNQPHIPMALKLADLQQFLISNISPNPNPLPNPLPNPSPNPLPNPLPNPISLDKVYQLNIATMSVTDLNVAVNNVTTGTDSMGEYLFFVKRLSSLAIKGIEDKFNSDFAIEMKLAINSQYSNIMGVEPDGLLNLRPDGSDWCFDVGQNNIITIPNSVSGANSIDIIKITRLNNTITLDVNGVLASKPVTQTYNTSNGLVVGNFQSFDGKIYGLKIFVPSPSLSS